MRINVTFDETDVAKVLTKIIKEPNAEEFVKLLTPMICQYSNASDWFFKLMLGDKLPEVIPNGTLCKTNISNLGYGANKKAIKAKYGDEFDKVVVIVKEFKGFHEYSSYMINFTNIDEHGNDKKDYTYVQASELAIIKEL